VTNKAGARRPRQTPPTGPAGDSQQRSEGMAGQGSQGNYCGGPCEVPFLLKKSLGKTGGPTSNQTKIQFKKNYFHYITY